MVNILAAIVNNNAIENIILIDDKRLEPGMIRFEDLPSTINSYNPNIQKYTLSATEVIDLEKVIENIINNA